MANNSAATSPFNGAQKRIPWENCLKGGDIHHSALCASGGFFQRAAAALTAEQKPRLRLRGAWVSEAFSS